jgi:hypothetical protein
MTLHEQTYAEPTILGARTIRRIVGLGREHGANVHANATSPAAVRLALAQIIGAAELVVKLRQEAARIKIESQTRNTNTEGSP